MARSGLVAALLLTTLTAAWPRPAPAVEEAIGGYTPGRGLALLDDRLVIGGYLALNLTALTQQRNRLTPEDVSLFLTWQPADHFKFFGEFEAEEPLLLDRSGLHTGNDIASLERLYAEWQPNDRVRLRLGKVLTPIGIWNPIHAAPLVWTVSRPLTTDMFFDTELTGITTDVVLHDGRSDLVATLFGQPTEHLDEPRDEQVAKRAAGGRLQLTTAAGPRLGLSYVRFEDENDHRWESTFAGDFLWETNRVELSSEMAINDPSSGATTWGTYVQAVYHPSWKVHVHPVARVEYVDLGSIDRLPFVLGLAWKPNLYTVVKVEGLIGGNDTDLGGEGLLASLAVLF